MDRQTDKINRQVDFLFVPPVDFEDSSGVNNTWRYNRAPEGYKFVLHSVQISTDRQNNRHSGIFTIYDGHEYTHWNIYPGVESKELLFRSETNSYNIESGSSLNNWECKEFTIAIRSISETESYKVCVIVWYYLRKMSELEKYQYACIQPRGEHIRKGGPTTVELSEQDG